MRVEAEKGAVHDDRLVVFAGGGLLGIGVDRSRQRCDSVKVRPSGRTACGDGGGHRAFALPVSSLTGLQSRPGGGEASNCCGVVTSAPGCSQTVE
jgi:hypothetical protein